MDINYLRLCQIKKEISSLVEESERIIKLHFAEQHSIAYSFWVPQILTALENKENWLSRSDHSMQETIDKIKYSIKND